MSDPQYWLGVVSREHALRGVASGIAQLNHGKRAALARMHAGDWLVCYSPRTSYPTGEVLQAFTAIGQVVSSSPYQVVVEEGFQPFRHDVHYLPSKEVPMSDVLADLSCFPDKTHWGARLRFGHMALPASDFWRIAAAMGVSVGAQR